MMSSSSCLRAAAMAVTSSGSEVPRATSVRAMNPSPRPSSAAMSGRPPHRGLGAGDHADQPDERAQRLPAGRQLVVVLEELVDLAGELLAAVAGPEEEERQRADQGDEQHRTLPTLEAVLHEDGEQDDRRRATAAPPA